MTRYSVHLYSLTLAIALGCAALPVSSDLQAAGTAISDAHSGKAMTKDTFCDPIKAADKTPVA